MIYTLQQKHRVSTVGELLALTDEYAAKLSAITSSDEHIEELKARCDALCNKVKKQAAVLTKARTAAAREVEKQMAARLVPLGMPNVRFQVEIGARKEPGIHGADTVNFLFSANKNGTLQSVSSVASGGEIARVMLSIKAMIAGAVKSTSAVRGFQGLTGKGTVLARGAAMYTIKSIFLIFFYCMPLGAVR